METQKKILLVQLFSYGDCLYATAVARQIKQDYPGCHLTWAIASFCKDILNGNPYVDEVRVVNTVRKSNNADFRNYKKEVYKAGGYAHIFITTNMDTNQAWYDGCIRSNILNAYPGNITVPVTPQVVLSDKEISIAKQFATNNGFDRYANIILFEYAPQSGQSNMTKGVAIDIAEQLVKDGDTVIILSSASTINHPNKAIIDGSILNFRETIALTHHCTFLLGSSSGITWASTSEGAKQLPMVQLINDRATWVNAVSRDFERFGFSSEQLIELTSFTASSVVQCVKHALHNFSEAKKEFNQTIKLHFKTTRKIVYNLLVYLEFKAIVTHIKANKRVYGYNPQFLREVILAFITFPFKLAKNLVTRRLPRKM